MTTEPSVLNRVFRKKKFNNTLVNRRRCFSRFLMFVDSCYASNIEFDKSKTEIVIEMIDCCNLTRKDLISKYYGRVGFTKRDTHETICKRVISKRFDVFDDAILKSIYAGLSGGTGFATRALFFYKQLLKFICHEKISDSAAERIMGRR